MDLLGVPTPFRAQGQSHECSPAMSLDGYFSTGPDRERPIFEVVMAHLDTVGPVHVEPVSVGIFLKRARTFAELRPMRYWEALSFSLPRTVRHPLIKRKVMDYHGRCFHHREPAHSRRLRRRHPRLAHGGLLRLARIEL